MAYTTNTALKTLLGISGSTDDTLLTTLIARAQAAIDAYCGRTFEGSNATRKYDANVNADGRTLWLDEDLASINTVTTNADASGGGTTIASTEYVTMPRNDAPYHAIRLLDSSSNEWTYTTDPEMGVEINGVWAYSASAPADIVHACEVLAAYYYKSKDAGTFDVVAIPDAGLIEVPQGIPAQVKMILKPYIKRVEFYA